MRERVAERERESLSAQQCESLKLQRDYTRLNHKSMYGQFAWINTGSLSLGHTHTLSTHTHIHTLTVSPLLSLSLCHTYSHAHTYRISLPMLKLEAATPLKSQRRHFCCYFFFWDFPALLVSSLFFGQVRT